MHPPAPSLPTGVFRYPREALMWAEIVSYAQAPIAVAYLGHYGIYHNTCTIYRLSTI